MDVDAIVEDNDEDEGVVNAFDEADIKRRNGGNLRKMIGAKTVFFVMTRKTMSLRRMSLRKAFLPSEESYTLP